MNLNKVLLMGNLTRDPVLRYLQSGQPVCEFGLAINRRFRRNEEWVEETCFVDITVWGRQGETCNQYLRKGSGAFVDGRLQFDSWQTPEGQKRSKLRVVAERVQFLPKGGQGPGTRDADASSEGDVSDFGARYQTEPDTGPAEYDSEVPF